MTPTQRELARHALGLPNSHNTSFRNHFCVGAGCNDYTEWQTMVENGLAIRRTGPLWGGSDMFHLTPKGILVALEPTEQEEQ